MTPVPKPLTTLPPMKQKFGRSKGSAMFARVGKSRLFRWHGLAGQGRLIDEEILGAEEPKIGWNHVTGGKPHDIAGNELLHRNFAETMGLVLSGGDSPLAVVFTMERSFAAPHWSDAPG